MGKRSKGQARCWRCRMPPAICVCDRIPRLDLATRVVVLMHYREGRRTTNTGQLAAQGLVNSALLMRGRPETSLDLAEAIGAGRQAYVLFPHEGAPELSLDEIRADGRPLTLVFPDGSWRQASKMARREPALAPLGIRTLPPGPTTRYFLRRAHTEAGLGTIEAIARALGLVEGPEVQRALEDLLDAMVERTLLTRHLPPGGLPWMRDGEA